MFLQLYLGVVPGMYPWQEEHHIAEKLHENNVGIILSYWSFRKHHQDLINKGLHDFLSYDGPIMLDSGAYSAFNSGVTIQVEDYSTFLTQLHIEDEDVVVNLDVVGDPIKSLGNWNYLKNRFDFPLLPVIHLPGKGLNYLEEPYVGLGGMVPAFKINQSGSVYDAAAWLARLSLYEEKKYHGFGIGSPFHQIAFSEYLHSVDWIGWRRNAAICDCYTPEGSRSIPEARKKKIRGKKLDIDLFEKYKPPFIDQYDVLHRPGTEGWRYRALWNVWWFLNAEEHRTTMETSTYVQRLKNKMNQVKRVSKKQSLEKFFNKR